MMLTQLNGGANSNGLMSSSEWNTIKRSFCSGQTPGASNFVAFVDRKRLSYGYIGGCCNQSTNHLPMLLSSPVTCHRKRNFSVVNSKFSECGKHSTDVEQSSASEGESDLTSTSERNP